MAIKSAIFYPDTEVSEVTIDTKYGTFFGSTIKRIDDPNPTSRFFGCQLAELRAIQRETRHRIRNKKLQLKTMNEFYDTLTHMRGYNPKASGAHHARQMIKVYTREIEKLTEKLEAINNYFALMSDSTEVTSE